MLIAFASVVLFAISAGQTPVDAELPPDIIVRAVRGRCEIVYGGSVLDGRALKRMGNGWPEGRPLLVVEPRGASRKCLIKITFKLAELGFNQVRFVDPAAEGPVTLLLAPDGLTRPRGLAR
jgi:hypothetical protein